MFHGQFIGRETVFKEYKKFSFHHIGLPFDDEAARTYVENFNWNFNDMIEETLAKYSSIYLPKYACAFLDQNTPDDEPGSLYIGVNDDGRIIGIPYQGVLSADFLSSVSLHNLIIGDENGVCQPFELCDLFDVEVVPIEYHNKELSIVHPQLSLYLQKQKAFEDKIQHHSEKYMKWQKKNDLYSGKLVDLYENPASRKEFLHYLRKLKKYEMIERVKKGETIEQQRYDKIREFRERGDNLYYWLCTWKDEILDDIRKKKPIREKAYKNIISRMENIYSPSHILINTGDLVPWWMQNNEGMNLYIIRFVFRKEKKDEIRKKGWTIRFIDHLRRSVTCFRTLVDNQPCCLPYDYM
jgi:hypothetical protein